MLDHQCILSSFTNCQGIARTQSPTTKNCTPKFPTFGRIANFSQARCNSLASTWAVCLRDHKQPAPGKLIKVCQLRRYEEAAVFNTCGSLITQWLTSTYSSTLSALREKHPLPHRDSAEIPTSAGSDVSPIPSFRFQLKRWPKPSAPFPVALLAAQMAYVLNI